MAQTPKYGSPFESQFDKDQALQHTIQMLISRVHTCTLVKVVEVTTGTANVGFLTVIPLIMETDTNNVVVSQTPIYNVPFFRYQSGTSAVVMDPVEGDTGIVFIAQHDITGIKGRAIQGQDLQGPANSDREYNSADALYIGGVLNGAVTQWVKFLANGAGIAIKTPGALTMEAATIALTATGGMTINANVTMTGTFTLNGTNVNTHVHGGGSLGSGETAGMQAP